MKQEIVAIKTPKGRLEGYAKIRVIYFKCYFYIYYNKLKRNLLKGSFRDNRTTNAIKKVYFVKAEYHQTISCKTACFFLFVKRIEKLS